LQEARLFAEENQLLFSETSAKTGTNVNEIFLMLGQQTILFFYFAYCVFEIMNNLQSHAIFFCF